MPNSGYKLTRKVFSGEHEKLIADFLVTLVTCIRHTDCLRMKLVSLLTNVLKNFRVNFPPSPNRAVISASGEDLLPEIISRNNVLSIRRPVCNGLQRMHFRTLCLQCLFSRE